MKYYPVSLNIEGKKAVIVGGGTVAARKAGELLRCGASVTVISPEISDELKELIEENKERVALLKREYKEGDLKGSFLAFGATDSSTVNTAVRDEAQMLGISVNIIDDPESGDFIVNGSREIGDLSWFISTNGKSPAMTVRLNREFENILPHGIDVILEKLGVCRDILKNDTAFGTLDSKDRGNLLRKISGSDELLGELKKLQGRKEIADFLKSLV